MTDGRHPTTLLSAIERSGLAAGEVGTPLSDTGLLMEFDRCISVLAATLDRLAASVVAAGGPESVSSDGADVWRSPAGIADAAANRLAAGSIDPGRLSAAYRSIQPERLVESLAERVDLVAGRSGALVLSNGAPVFDNIVVADGELVGLVSWERAAFADRHRDLAVAASGLVAFSGPAPIPALFSRLATDADPVLLDWYLLAVDLLG